MWLFLAFLAVPLIEIALFIQVGGFIGLFPTLAIVILTAILGTYMVRSQGARAMGDLRGSFSDLRDPTEPLAHGAMILISAALLLTPGFFTDAVGFALLIPGVRRAVMAYARKRINVQSFEMGGQAHPRGHRDASIIEGEFSEVPDVHEKPGPAPGEDGASGWTRQ